MRLPTVLLRRNKNVHKNQFGHVLILAGSRHMLGAGCLSSLAALRAGAGLVTLGVPASLNRVAQKKVSNCVMTLSLAETKEQSLSDKAFPQLQKNFSKYKCVAIGPGLSLHPQTQTLVHKIISTCPVTLVIDADALNALSQKNQLLTKTATAKILTPHPGEMAHLTGQSQKQIEAHRKEAALNFAKKFHCTLVLKGSRSVVASPEGKIYINTTGNAGLATAGSGDVLTGIIAALVAQGVEPFEAAKAGVYLHGVAADLAVKRIPKASLIASDIIDFILQVIKFSI